MLPPRAKRRMAAAIVTVVLLAALVWVRFQSDPVVTAVASLTDPEKLATLKSERAANPRVLKCIYWLHQAKQDGRKPEEIISKAQKRTRHREAHARLVKEALLRNLDIAEKLGCVTEENLERMKRGRSPTIGRGPYTGEQAEVDHIVPVARAPELDKEMANLELMPATLNRRKGARIGARQLDYINRFVVAELITEEIASRIRGAAN